MMVAIRDICELSERIAREFQPDKIVLFGSYAGGRPGEDSDVDLLVVMGYKGRSVDKATEIRQRLEPRFPLDLLVRSPQEISQRLAWHDWFLMDIFEKGKVLYESAHPGMD
ncbi:MAG: nucleotidyltransferase domain-containing protein [Phycisphaerae bacterium]